MLQGKEDSYSKAWRILENHQRAGSESFLKSLDPQRLAAVGALNREWRLLTANLRAAQREEHEALIEQGVLVPLRHLVSLVEEGEFLRDCCCCVSPRDLFERIREFSSRSRTGTWVVSARKIVEGLWAAFAEDPEEYYTCDALRLLPDLVDFQRDPATFLFVLDKVRALGRGRGGRRRGEGLGPRGRWGGAGANRPWESLSEGSDSEDSGADDDFDDDDDWDEAVDWARGTAREVACLLLDEIRSKPDPTSRLITLGLDNPVSPEEIREAQLYEDDRRSRQRLRKHAFWRRWGSFWKRLDNLDEMEVARRASEEIPDESWVHQRLRERGLLSEDGFWKDDPGSQALEEILSPDCQLEAELAELLEADPQEFKVARNSAFQADPQET